MDEMMDEYKKIFLEEAEEYITALNENLLKLEKEKKNRKLITNIFRVAHTLKSSAAAVGYNDLSTLSHKAEDLMQEIRNVDKEVTTTIIDTLFEVFDIVKEYIQCIKDNKKVDVDIDGMIKKLDSIIKNSDIKDKGNKKEKNRINKTGRDEEIVNFNEYERKLIEEKMKEGGNGYLLKVEIDPREQLKWLRAELLLNNINKVGEIVKIYPDKDKFLSKDFTGIFSVLITSREDENIIPEIIKIDLIKNITIEPAAILDKSNTKDKAKQESEQPKQKEKKSRKIENQEKLELRSDDEMEKKSDEYKTERHQITASGDTIRVPVKKIDNLMHLIEELVITNSGLKIIEQKVSDTYKDKATNSDMSFVTDKLINISSELQNSIMKTRMLPISNIFIQFNRIVRDLAKEEKKEIDLIIRGGDTELDKKVIDTIGDPIMHLVRNSVDHGIEHPADRIKNGKPPKGTIILSASQSGNHIIISIKDDGPGIDIEKVKEKAVKDKLINKNAIEEMSEQQILSYIFKPGFSTSEKVNAISGRGVGLDVVKNVTGQLSGTVDINTEPGKGTEFIITLPLTLAITSVIMIRSGDNIYAIPISDIEENLRIKRDEINTIQGIKVIKLRNEIIPLVNVHNVFAGNKAGINKVNDDENMLVVIVSYRNKKTGLIVDGIIGRQEIVLKPLEEHYQAIEGLSGAAILGDGRIILIIDVIGVMNLIKELGDKLSEITKQEERNITSLLINKEKEEREKEEKVKEKIKSKDVRSRDNA